MKRILVTGSRDWFDLPWLAFWLGRELGTDPDAVVIHGDCPTGADRMARDLCLNHGVPEWRFPADWERYGKRAGFIRNDEMVKAGPDVCLAFILNGSSGATMCADLAERSGIVTRRAVVNVGVRIT